MKNQKTKAGRRTLLLLIAAAMLITMQGVPVWAETAAAVERIGEPSAMLTNPVHHCTKKNDGTDTTDWSYVYFGSYPQSEVTESALTSAITGASYNASGDAWVNGMKYRRISASDTNYSGYFGDGEYRYFKWERIKWRVLKSDGSTMFVMADKALDCKCYNDIYKSITWETCTLRNWLNNDFYGTAFSSSEQEAIVSQTVANENNPYYNTDGGNDTVDKVYSLSLSEVMNQDYGFCENDKTHSMSRRLKASDYAHVRGVWIDDTDSYAGGCMWCLRSPGYDAYDSAVVNSSGYVGRSGSNVDNYNDACVPALHINLSSEFWLMTDDGSSGEGGGNGSGTAEISGEEGGETEGNNTTGENNSTGKNNGTEENLNTENPTVPTATPIQGKVKAKSKAFLIKWKKQTDVTGYQIQYSTNKKFKKKATKLKTIANPSTTKQTIKKLKPAKKYYVRVRTYQETDGVLHYSEWSKTKTVNTKK